MLRRKKIFIECPAAKNHDNWDIGVIVDEHRKEFSRDVAIKNIEQLLTEREPFYRDNDLDLNTENQLSAVEKLKALNGDCDRSSETEAKSTATGVTL